VAVLDRAGVRSDDFDPAEEKVERRSFNPRDYSPEELVDRQRDRLFKQ
jgi:hypothetical protein